MIQFLIYLKDSSEFEGRIHFIEKGKRIYQIQRPESLLEFIRQKKEELETQEKLAKDLIKNIANELVTNAGVYKWTMVTPSTVATVTHNAILSTTTSFGKTFYLKISRPVTLGTGGNPDTYPITYVNFSIGTSYDTTAQDLTAGTASPPSKLSWYDDENKVRY